MPADNGRKADRPPPVTGMKHVALVVEDLAACERFYVELLGYEVEWRPDRDNLYITCGADNVALHRGKASGGGALDHFGILVSKPEHVDAWFEFLRAHDVPIDVEPKTHRDGARSFYCFDPAGNRLQMIYHPPLSDPKP